MQRFKGALSPHVHESLMTLSTEQQLIAQYLLQRIVNSGFDGRAAGHPIALRAFGGSGKTHMLRAMCNNLTSWRINFAVVAFTGRAAAQIAKEGIPAKTCHSLLKEPVMDEQGNLIRWKDRDIDEIRAAVGSVIFVDEASMIPEDMHLALTAAGVLVIYIGDDEQQPPVNSEGCDPDFDVFSYVNNHPNGIILELTHNFRQASGSKIAEACYHIRTTGRIPQLPASLEYQVIRQSAVWNLTYHKENHFDLMVCGTNATRKRLNRLARTARGFDDPEVAMTGETVMCLSNDIIAGVKINNGELFKVEWMSRGEHISSFNLSALDREGVRVTVKVHNDCWLGEEGPFTINGDPNKKLGVFGFGYASTSYKVQGSQADKVLMIDEDTTFFLDRRKYRYTCASRARQHLTIAV
ncbi:MAG: hypothetical protein CMF22_11160 [Idiomarinaceae bacterium]|nr:hypothetical protein [Idiomarinaceae bacterium]